MMSRILLRMDGEKVAGCIAFHGTVTKTEESTSGNVVVDKIWMAAFGLTPRDHCQGSAPSET
jgi:hypothetical protein